MTARKEVILSAGVINTPQLLMLSGIGDSTELMRLGIPTRVNLPSVGKNLTDHVMLANAWRVNNNETSDSHLTPDVLPQNIQEWNKTHQGPLSWINTNQMAWMRLSQNDTILQAHGDPSPGQTSAHYQFIWMNGWSIPGLSRPEGSWMTFLTNLISPTSRKRLIPFTPSFVRPLTIFRTGGEVKLRNLNPFDPPIINPDFLSTDFDIQTIITAVKVAKRFTTAQAWRGFVIAPWEPLASANTDEEIAQYARNHAGTYVEPLDYFPLRSSNIIDRMQSVPPRWNRSDIPAWGSMGGPRP